MSLWFYISICCSYFICFWKKLIACHLVAVRGRWEQASLKPCLAAPPSVPVKSRLAVNCQPSPPGGSAPLSSLYHLLFLYCQKLEILKRRFCKGLKAGEQEHQWSGREQENHAILRKGYWLGGKGVLVERMLGESHRGMDHRSGFCRLER